MNAWIDKHDKEHLGCLRGTIGSLEIKRSDKYEGAEAARAHVLQLDEVKAEQLEVNEEVLERLVLQEDLDPRHRANGR